MPLPTTFTAGIRLRASQLLDMLRVLRGFNSSTVGTCSGALTLVNGVYNDIPGMTTSVTIVGANAYVVVTINAQVVVTLVDATAEVGVALLIDGVQQAGQGTLRKDMKTLCNAHHSYMWKVGVSAGAHTIKAQAQKTAAGGTGQISNTAGSNIVVQVYDMP